MHLLFLLQSFVKDIYDFYHQTPAGVGHDTWIGVSLLRKLVISGIEEDSERQF